MLVLSTGGFEHVLSLTKLTHLDIDGFWNAFEDLPRQVTAAGLQEKLGYLRDRLEASAVPLL